MCTLWRCSTSVHLVKLLTRYSVQFSESPCLSRVFYHQRQHDRNSSQGLTYYWRNALSAKTSWKYLNGSGVNDQYCSNSSNYQSENGETNEQTSDVDFSKMTAAECKIHHIHAEACKAGQDTYIDPATGYTVLTRFFHINKGKCCGNDCRHCPYNHMAVPEEHRKKRFNSSFYV